MFKLPLPNLHASANIQEPALASSVHSDLGKSENCLKFQFSQMIFCLFIYWCRCQTVISMYHKKNYVTCFLLMYTLRKADLERWPCLFRPHLTEVFFISVAAAVCKGCVCYSSAFAATSFGLIGQKTICL